MKGRVLNGSRSSMCSPVPMNVMGLFVTATLCVYEGGGHDMRPKGRERESKHKTQGRRMENKTRAGWGVMYERKREGRRGTGMGKREEEEREKKKETERKREVPPSTEAEFQ